MSTLVEIEAAVEKLADDEREELLRFILKRRQLEQSAPASLRDELLRKWRSRATGIVDESGGPQAFQDAIRGRDDDGG